MWIRDASPPTPITFYLGCVRFDDKKENPFFCSSLSFQVTASGAAWYHLNHASMAQISRAASTAFTICRLKSMPNRINFERILRSGDCREVNRLHLKTELDYESIILLIRFCFIFFAFSFLSTYRIFPIYCRLSFSVSFYWVRLWLSIWSIRSDKLNVDLWQCTSELEIKWNFVLVAVVICWWKNIKWRIEVGHRNALSYVVRSKWVQLLNKI